MDTSVTPLSEIPAAPAQSAPAAPSVANDQPVVVAKSKPSFSMPKINLSPKTRMVTAVLGIFILVGGLLGGYYLSKQRQVQPKADNNTCLTLEANNCYITRHYCPGENLLGSGCSKNSEVFNNVGGENRIKIEVGDDVCVNLDNFCGTWQIDRACNGSNNKMIGDYVCNQSQPTPTSTPAPPTTCFRCNSSLQWCESYASTGTCTTDCNACPSQASPTPTTPPVATSTPIPTQPTNPTSTVTQCIPLTNPSGLSQTTACRVNNTDAYAALSWTRVTGARDYTIAINDHLNPAWSGCGNNGDVCITYSDSLCSGNSCGPYMHVALPLDREYDWSVVANPANAQCSATQSTNNVFKTPANCNVVNPTPTSGTINPTATTAPVANQCRQIEVLRSPGYPIDFTEIRNGDQLIIRVYTNGPASVRLDISGAAIYTQVSPSIAAPGGSPNYYAQFSFTVPANGSYRFSATTL